MLTCNPVDTWSIGLPASSSVVIYEKRSIGGHSYHEGSRCHDLAWVLDPAHRDGYHLRRVCCEAHQGKQPCVGHTLADGGLDPEARHGGPVDSDGAERQDVLRSAGPGAREGHLDPSVSRDVARHLELKRVRISSACLAAQVGERSTVDGVRDVGNGETRGLGAVRGPAREVDLEGVGIDHARGVLDLSEVEIVERDARVSLADRECN